MAERRVVLEPDGTPETATQDISEALRQANLRAERAERELARVKGQVAGGDGGSVAGQTGARAGEDGSGREAQARPTEGREARGDDAETALRRDSMMAHLLDSLAAGKDIGHYGRLVFAMVARHFMPREEVAGWLRRDPDFGDEQAEVMLRQVEGRDYNPPRRDRIVAWQREQEFPILPNPEGPDCGNLYRTLKFPDAVYEHIEEYREQKVAAEDAA